METTKDVLVPNLPWLNKVEKVDFINSAYRRFYKTHQVELDDADRKCKSTGQYTLREDVWKLEKSIADFVGAKYGIGVNSGTDALFLSLLALGVGKGDEVITVSNTFIATIQAIVHTGATPILIDVKEDELMDADQLEAAITSRTKAIIPVQYTGAVCDMDRIWEIANKYNLHIVDDYCQALGASYGDEKAGSFGIFNAVSFNTAKLLGGQSDGGMITTDDEEFAKEVALLRNHYNAHQLSVDRNDYPQPEVMKWAWKSRLSNVNAAFLNVKFKTIDRILSRRKEIALKYNEELKDLPLKTPHDQEGRIWQEYHLRVKDREAFAQFMKEKGVETLTRDVVPNHKMPGLGLDHFNLPVTEQLAKEVTRLPLHEWLTDEEVGYVIKCAKEYYGQ